MSRTDRLVSLSEALEACERHPGFTAALVGRTYVDARRAFLSTAAIVRAGAPEVRVFRSPGAERIVWPNGSEVVPLPSSASPAWRGRLLNAAVLLQFDAEVPDVGWPAFYTRPTLAALDLALAGALADAGDFDD